MVECFTRDQGVAASYSFTEGSACTDPEGGGTGGPGLTGKSQVIWVSIGYKQLDPPGIVGSPPWKILEPL